MVEGIKEYRQYNGVCILKVYLKPTRKFPEGRNYFYAPAEALSLVQRYTWCLRQEGNRVCVIAHTRSDYCWKTILFHKELFKFYQGYDWNGDIDHINHIELDNTDQNLNAVLRHQNNYNKFTRGYFYNNDLCYFQPLVHINSKTYYPFSVTVYGN